MSSLLRRSKALLGVARRIREKQSNRKMGIVAADFRFDTKPLKYIYRNEGSMRSQKAEYWSTAIGALMWYWILFHFYYDWGMFVGEFTLPTAKDWTDEELGIPPDDED